MSAPLVGLDIERVDGALKVTGRAAYSADVALEGLAHVVAVPSRIARGRIARIDDRDARAAPGVIAVITHENAPRLSKPVDSPYLPDVFRGKAAERWLPLQDAEIAYAGQVIALVVAETLEQAQFAAARLRIDYETQAHDADIASRRDVYRPTSAVMHELNVGWGDFDAAFARAPATLDATYTTPIENHNPIEPSATVAAWDGDALTLYDTTQTVMGTAGVVAQRLGISHERVRVVSRFLGGGFGCKGFVWHQPTLAAMAARVTGRPAKLVLTRAQMFTSVGHRPHTLQRVRLGASAGGQLLALHHTTVSETSKIDEYVEPAGFPARSLYACENVRIEHELTRLNVNTPTPMRGPGETTGTFALESALDELAYALDRDPIELRLVNYAHRHPETGRPWSSKRLEECYWRGARLIGWHRRARRPGARRDRREWIGYGVASAVFPAYRSPASARARLTRDGELVVASATQDIGTGTYTVMSQVAADVLRLPLARVRFELGDTHLPPAPVSGGSQTAASVSTAVHTACSALVAELARLATGDRRSPLFGADQSEIETGDGALFLRNRPNRRDSYARIVQRAERAHVEVTQRAPNDAHRERFAFQSTGAQFAEVRVDRDIGRLRVTRLVGVFDAGRILNPKTARSQAVGGMIYGLGMALMERTLLDPGLGRVVNDNLGDYLVPVHADIPAIETAFIDEPDPYFGPLGARGIGEIGTTGVAAAIANAVYNAVGVRVRDLPIGVEALLQP